MSAEANEPARASTAFPVRTLLYLLLFGFVCRAGWWALRISVIENEGCEYARITQTWFSGQGYLGALGGLEVMFPPAYPALIGVLAMLVGSVEVAGRLVSFGAGLLLIATSFAVTRRIFGEREGVVAGCLAAAHPLLVALSVTMYCEALALSLTMLSVFFALEASSPELFARFPRFGALSAAALAGLSVGVAYLVRPELIVFSPVIAAFLFAAGLRRKSARFSGLRLSALCLLATLVLAVPYMAHLSGIAGHFRWEGKTASNEVINERMRGGMSFPEAARGLDYTDDFDKHVPFLGGPDLWGDQSVFFHSPGSGKGRGLGDLVKAIPSRITGVFGLIKFAALEWFSVFKIPLGMLAFVAGLFGSRFWRRERWVEATFFLAVAGVQAAFLLGVMFLWGRYAFPLVPLMLPWVAVGVVFLIDLTLRLSRRVSADRLPRLVGPLSVGAAALFCFGMYRKVANSDDFKPSHDREPKTAGLWIREQPDEFNRPGLRRVLMGYGSVLAHYADADLAYLPFTKDGAHALRYVHWKSPDYIALRSTETYEGEYFAEWLEHGIPDPCAAPVYKTEGPTGVTRVWRWTCPN